MRSVANLTIAFGAYALVLTRRIHGGSAALDRLPVGPASTCYRSSGRSRIEESDLRLLIPGSGAAPKNAAAQLEATLKIFEVSATNTKRPICALSKVITGRANQNGKNGGRSVLRSRSLRLQGGGAWRTDPYAISPVATLRSVELYSNRDRSSLTEAQDALFTGDQQVHSLQRYRDLGANYRATALPTVPSPQLGWSH